MLKRSTIELCTITNISAKSEQFAKSIQYSIYILPRFQSILKSDKAMLSSINWHSFNFLLFRDWWTGAFDFKNCITIRTVNCTVYYSIYTDAFIDSNLQKEFFSGLIRFSLIWCKNCVVYTIKNFFSPEIMSKSFHADTNNDKFPPWQNVPHKLNKKLFFGLSFEQEKIITNRASLLILTKKM